MNYHEYEVLAKYKRQEFEEIAKNSLVLSTIKHESSLQKAVKFLVHKLKNHNTQSKDTCCTTQCCIS